MTLLQILIAFLDKWFSSKFLLNFVKKEFITKKSIAISLTARRYQPTTVLFLFHQYLIFIALPIVRSNSRNGFFAIVLQQITDLWSQRIPADRYLYCLLHQNCAIWWSKFSMLIPFDRIPSDRMLFHWCALTPLSSTAVMKSPISHHISNCN